jgi:hypothetical protein
MHDDLLLLVHSKEKQQQVRMEMEAGNQTRAAPRRVFFFPF